MPFGSIFGLLFFGVLCVGLGLHWVVHPMIEARIAGLLLALLGGSLAIGLVRRRTWARWSGVLVGLLLAVFGLRRVADEGGVLEHLLVFAALAAAVLLIVPATGAARRAGVSARPERVGASGWTALASFAGLLVVGLWVGPDPQAPPATKAGALPASAIGRSVRWDEFGPGLARARSEAKPVLATFVTDWCPYCSKMSRKTWRASAVVERLDDVVPVKVDAEGARRSGGFSGRELAERYGISSYPVQLLLDAEGRVMARHEGYQGPRELLSWMDGALGVRPAGSLASATGSSR